MNNVTRNKIISGFLITILWSSLILLNLRTEAVTQALASIEMPSTQELNKFNFFERAIQNQDLKITRSDLEKWISSSDNKWFTFTHPDGGLSVEYPATWKIKIDQSTDQKVYFMIPPDAHKNADQTIQIVKYPNQKLQTLEDWFKESQNYLGVVQDLLNELPKELIVLNQGQLSLQVYGMPASSPEVHVFVANGNYIFDIVVISPLIKFFGVQMSDITTLDAPEAPIFQFPMSSPDTPYWKFGYFRHFCGPYHSGTDYHVSGNSNIYAAANGKVVVSKVDSKTISDPTKGYGQYIVLAHKLPDSGQIIYSLYAHLNSRLISSPGKTVNKGVTIGKEGKTGGANNTPHLHFELRKYLDFNVDQCGNYKSLDYLNARFYNPDEFILSHMPGTITGLIKDSNGRPANNAIVKFYSRGFNQTTSSMNGGFYKFQEAPSGNAIIIAEKDRKWGVARITVRANTTSQVNIVLSNECVFTGSFVCAPTPPPACFSSSEVQDMATDSCNILPTPGPTPVTPIPTTPPTPSNCTPDNKFGVYLYSDKNFRGTCSHIIASVNDLAQVPVGNDNVSSIRIIGDYKVILFQDKDFKGRSDEINKDESDLDKRSLGNQYSSARVEATNLKCDNTSRPGVYLYSEKKYKGNCFYTISDIPNFDLTPITDNHLRSVWIVGSFEVKIYKDKQYGEPHVRFSQSRDDLTKDSLGNQYSSIQVYLKNPLSSISIPALVVVDPTDPIMLTATATITPPVDTVTPPPTNEPTPTATPTLIAAPDTPAPIDTPLPTATPIPTETAAAPLATEESALTVTPTSEVPSDTPTPTVAPLPVETPTPTALPIAPPVVSQPDQIILAFAGPTSVVPGETFQVAVQAQGVTGAGLYGAQLEINYDPARVSVSNVQINPEFVFGLRNSVDNVNGKIEVVASRQGAVPGLIGDVNLLTFEVTPAVGASGEVSFTFTNAKVGNPQAIAYLIIPQTYTVFIEDSPTPTFTPSPTAIPTLPPAPTSTGEPTLEPVITPTPTFTPLPTGEPTITPTSTLEPTAATVSGQVTLLGRANSNWSGAVVTINDSGQNASTDIGGNFTIPAVGLGSHTAITADAPGYLPAVCTPLTVTAPETRLAIVSLLSGDLNDDNKVDAVDATTIGVNFGLAGSNMPADINRDEVVDILDLILVSINFEQETQGWNCLGQ